MNKKQIALWCVMGDFVAFSAYTVYSDGYFAFLGIAAEFATSSLWGAQILIDFLIALGMALGWVIFDARKRNVAYWPFILLTLTLGSIGPLAYLIQREQTIQSVANRSGGRSELQHA